VALCEEDVLTMPIECCEAVSTPAVAKKAVQHSLDRSHAGVLNEQPLSPVQDPIQA